MRTLPSPVLARLAAREGLVARVLVWIEARHRDTLMPAALGLWSGEDHQDFVVGGATRTYYGAGTLLSMPPLTAEVGLKVRSHRLSLSPLAPEVVQVMRGYDPRLAPVDIHVAHFDPGTGNLLAPPARVFRGVLNTVSVDTPAEGGEARIEVELLSAAQSLTRSLALKKSDESLRARSPDDAFRQYIAVTGAVEAVWGEARAQSPSAN